MPSSLVGMLSSAGGGSFVGGAAVRLLLDNAQFNAGLASAQGKLAATGRKMEVTGARMSRLGGSLTRGLTVPIIAAGAAAGKLAVDFETAFTRIRANTNLTGKEITQLRGFVMDLAGETAKSPQELAEALYFLASAGLSANQVQETLAMSAKASAAGFGITGDIARLTANALNAYAKEGLRAKEVTDTLAAGIREGTAEPEEFANALGRILPVAQKAGVGFDEVVASLASLSNIGLDVNEGVTAMRGLMASLFSPTQQSRDALAEFNLTADELRRIMAEDGVLAVLRLLEERTHGNIDALRKIVPNIRAMTGMFGLTGQEADKVTASFRRVEGATGDLDRAFDKTRKSSAFQMQKTLAELQTVGIQIGQNILPILKDLAKGIQDITDWFSNLDPQMRKNIVRWGLLAAALGPVVGLLGNIVRLGGGAGRVLSSVFRKGVPGAPGTVPGGPATTAAGGRLIAGAARFVRAHPAATVATVALGVALKKVSEASAEHSKELEAARRTIIKYGFEGEQAAKAMRLLGIEEKALNDLSPMTNARDQHRAEELHNLREAHREYMKAITGTIEAGRIYIDVTRDSLEMTTREQEKIAGAIRATNELGVAIDADTRKRANNLLKVGDVNGALRVLNENLREGIDRYYGSADALGGFVTKLRTLKDVINGIPKNTQIRVDTIFTTTGTGIYGNKPLPFANGGILAAASGLITQGPITNGRVMAGEGNYPTSFGRGAEAIVPLHDRTLDRLGAAIGRHVKGGDGPIHLTVMLDGQVLARVVTKHQTRTLQLKEA